MWVCDTQTGFAGGRNLATALVSYWWFPQASNIFVAGELCGFKYICCRRTMWLQIYLLQEKYVASNIFVQNVKVKHPHGHQSSLIKCWWSLTIIEDEIKELLWFLFVNFSITLFVYCSAPRWRQGLTVIETSECWRASTRQVWPCRLCIIEEGDPVIINEMCRHKVRVARVHFDLGYMLFTVLEIIVSEIYRIWHFIV